VATIDGSAQRLEILDTAAHEEICNIHHLTEELEKSQGFVLVYSITDRPSFNDLPDIRDVILRCKDSDVVPMILVGNKSDLAEERMISTDEGATLAKSFGCPFMEISAQSKDQVDGVFAELVRTEERSNRRYD
jgi:small GTP-binding protein